MGFPNIPDNEVEVIQNHVAEIFIIADMGGLQHFQMGVIFAGAIPFNDFMPDGIDKGVEVLNLHGGNPIHINLNVRKKLDKVLMGGKFAEQTVVNPTAFQKCYHLMMQMDVGPLFGLFLQSFFIGITMRILSIVIFVIVYGRMIEIYMMVSLAPVPMATWGNHEQSHVGQNYLRSLFALGFQGFLILICVAIYAVLLQNVAISGDAINSIWSIVGYTVLLCFTLFKTGSVARSILGAH